jgi:hypothetical protein
LLCFAAGASLVLAITLLWLLPPPVKVTKHDPKVRTLSAKLLTSTNDCFYVGNQMEGQVRDFLSRYCHIKVQPLLNLQPVARSSFFNYQAHPPEPDNRSLLALWVAFGKDQKPANPMFDLELRDASGRLVALSGIYLASHNNEPYQSWKLLDLDRCRTNAGKYSVRLVQTGICLAEITLPDLPAVERKPPHLGPNAF